MVSQMREAVEYSLCGQDENVRTNARLAMGAAPAEQITNAFFAIVERVAELDDEEMRVSMRLKKEVKDAIADRNDFAHGDWATLWKEQGPRLRRMKPGRRAGPEVERVLPVDRIDAMANAVDELGNTVCEFAMICLGIHPLEERTGMAVRVRDIYRFRKHQVLRIGRYAEMAWYEWEEDEYEEED